MTPCYRPRRLPVAPMAGPAAAAAVSAPVGCPAWVIRPLGQDRHGPEWTLTDEGRAGCGVARISMRSPRLLRAPFNPFPCDEELMHAVGRLSGR